MDRRESLAALAEFSSATGIPMALPSSATVLNVNFTDWHEGNSPIVSVTLQVLEVKETVRETRYLRRGVKMMIWTCVTGEVNAYDAHYDVISGWGDYWTFQSIVSWESDFTPYTEHKIGRIETPAEYAERRRWEGMQYRVGTSRSPMDNAEVAACESDTTPAMYRHWMKG
jgi:hypothetical protein